MPPIDFNELDTTVHGPVRLGILTALQMDGPHNFTTLKMRLKASDGALGMHLQTLETEGYIANRKAFVCKRPRTTYRLTPKDGRRWHGTLRPCDGSSTQWRQRRLRHPDEVE